MRRRRATVRLHDYRDVLPRADGRTRAGRTGLGLVALVLLFQLFGVPAVAEPEFGRCAEAPEPEVINSGMVGSIDYALKGTKDSLYRDFGYAGQVWHTFDAGSGVLCSAPQADINTWVGNTLFDIGKVMVATANSLHYTVSYGGVAHDLDTLVKNGVQATYQGFAQPFLPIALLLVGIAGFWYVFRGDNAGAVKSGGRVLAGLGLVAATAFSPMIYSTIFDDVLIEGVQEAQQKLDGILYDELDTGASEDQTAYYQILPTTLHQRLVRDTWLKGEFGSSDDPLAQRYGRDLVWAQACSWTEAREGRCDPQAKKKRFKEIAASVQQSGSYATFTGEDGSRSGTGALAMVQSILFCSLQIVAKLGILLAQLVLRMLVLFGPVIGILAMAPGVGRTVLRGIGGVAGLGLVMLIVAGVHTYVSIQLLESTTLGTLEQLAIMALFTMLVWTCLRPVKRLKQMMASTLHTMPGEGFHRTAQWLQHTRLRRAMRRRRNREVNLTGGGWWSNRRPRDTRPNAADGTTDDDGPGTVWASAQRPESGSLPIGGFRPGGQRGASDGDASGAGTPPRGPHGPAPAGRGPTASPAYDQRQSADHHASPGTIRAEATRLHRNTNTDTEQPAAGIPAARPSLPPGTAPREEPASATRDSQDRSELIVPSEIIDTPEASQGDIREAPSATERGRQSYVLYRPSSDRMESDQSPGGDPPTSPRPEAADHDRDRHSRPTDPSGGES